jgi:hypothetical protein
MDGIPCQPPRDLVGAARSQARGILKPSSAQAARGVFPSAIICAPCARDFDRAEVTEVPAEQDHGAVRRRTGRDAHTLVPRPRLSTRSRTARLVAAALGVHAGTRPCSCRRARGIRRSSHERALQAIWPRKRANRAIFRLTCRGGAR